MTPEQLGVDQRDPAVLRLPDGFLPVSIGLFEDTKIKTVIVPNSVTELGVATFRGCKHL